MNPFQRQFERCALVSLEKREKLLSFAGEHVLHLDLDNGTARFSDRVSFPFQILGTESENTLTWLWAWAEEQTEMPGNLTASSRHMRDWLLREGMADLALPSLDLHRADGTMLSVVAADLCGAGAFYRDPYEGGALFMLLFSSDVGRLPDLDRAGLVRILGDLISRYDLDHRFALLSYFRSKSLPFSETDDTVNARLAGGERLVAEFLPDGRVLRIDGEPLS